MDTKGQSKSARQRRFARLALVSMVIVLALAILLVVLATRNILLAQRLELPVEQQNTQYEFIWKATSHQPLSEADSYHFRFCRLPKGRWVTIQNSPFRLPQPGEQISLSGDSSLSVPSYLPEGFKWLDVILNSSGRSEFPMFAACMEGANGEPPPYYDLSFVTFLTGGDEDNHLLILTQVNNNAETELSVRFFYLLAPAREPDFASMRAESAPTQDFAAIDLLVGLVVEPAATDGISIPIGSQELNETIVDQQKAWWYHGTWSVEDTWDASDTLTNLIWKRADYIYQLTGEGIALEELIKTAESMP